MNWTLLIALLLLFAGLRLVDLLSFPPFIDEAVHIDWADDIYQLHPLTGAANGKLFGLWWAAPLGLFGDGALFLIRAGGVLFAVLGAAVLYRLARESGGPLAGGLALGLYAVTPYSLFYDRLALMDNAVLPWALLAAWAAWRMMTRGTYRAAMVCGVALAGAILAKATGIVLIALPVLAVGLAPRRIPLARRITGLAGCFGVLVSFWGPFYLLLRSRGFSYLGTATTVVGTGDVAGLPARLLENLAGMGHIDQAYFSLPFLLIGLALTIWLIWRRPRTGLFWVAAVLVPLAGLLAFSVKLSARYFYFHVPLLIGLVAVALALLSKRLRPWGRWASMAGLALPLGWAALVGVPFLGQLLSNPAGLDLPLLDRQEYISADSAGFALPEVAQILLAEAASEDAPARVFGLLPNCGGLRLSIPANAAVDVVCPLLAPDGSTQSAIATEVNLAIQQGRSVWIVYEAAPYVSLDGISGVFVERARYSRPDDLTRVTVLQAEPEAD